MSNVNELNCLKTIEENNRFKSLLQSLYPSHYLQSKIKIGDSLIKSMKENSSERKKNKKPKKSCDTPDKSTKKQKDKNEEKKRIKKRKE